MAKMTKLTSLKIFTSAFAFALLLLVGRAEAAPACGIYGGLNDPACYTGSGGGTVYESCWWDGPYYDNMYRIKCCWPDGNCRYQYLDWGWIRDGNGYWCGNGHFGTGTDTTNPSSYAGSYSVAPTYTCHYIDSVTAWGACSGGQKLATAVHWATVAGTDCTNVATQMLCGMCNPASAGVAYDSIAAIQSAYSTNPTSICSYGALQAVTYKSATEPYWNWTCKYATGDPSGICTGLNSYIDIGLRIKDDRVPGGVIKVGVEKSTQYSPVIIYKNGTRWHVGVFSNPLDPYLTGYLSNARIKTAAGTEIIIGLP